MNLYPDKSIVWQGKIEKVGSKKERGWTVYLSLCPLTSIRGNKAIVSVDI